MRATVMHAASDVRNRGHPDAGLREPTDGIDADAVLECVGTQESMITSYCTPT